MDVKSILILDVAAALGIEVNDKGFCRCLQNEDKTPSMHLDSKKNLWKCFSCGNGGTNIDLVKQALGIDVGEAFRWLEEHFNGVPIPPAPQQIKTNENKEEARDYSEIYYFLMTLGEMPPAAVEYLTKERGIRKELIDVLGILYFSPALRLKVKAALKSKFDREDLIAAGLLPWSKKTEQRYYLFFGCNYLFPFWKNGKIVHIQGRLENVIEGKKYLHLEGKKVEHPYGLNILEALHPGSEVYLLEGLFDSLTLNSIDLNAIGIPGACFFNPDYKALLNGFRVNFISQNDSRRVPGQSTAAETLERKVRELLPEARIFHIPAKYKDMNDWHMGVQGGLSKELLARELVEVREGSSGKEAENTATRYEGPRIELATASQLASGLIGRSPAGS